MEPFTNHSADVAGSVNIFWSKKALSEFKQGDMLVVDYFAKLRIIWSEYVRYDTIPECSCGAMKVCKCEVYAKLEAKRDKEFTLHFLMGLNESFTIIRNKILVMSPFPNINKVFSEVLQQEKPREIDLENRSVDSNPMATPQKVPFKQYRRPFCTHCGEIGRTTDECLTFYACPLGYKGKDKEEEGNKHRKEASGDQVGDSSGSSAQSHQASQDGSNHAITDQDLSGAQNVANASQLFQHPISHRVASTSGFAASTGSNKNKSGQQATGGVQIGENLHSTIYNMMGNNSENEETYPCFMSSCSDMVEGLLCVSNMEELVFRYYNSSGVESKLVMPLQQVKLVQPYMYRSHQIIQILMVDGRMNYRFLRFGNFDWVVRRLLEAKPHPYLSFTYDEITVVEKCSIQGFFSKLKDKDLISQPTLYTKYKERYECSHDTHLGQIKGKLYISSTTLEFCSDKHVSCYSSNACRGTLQHSFYRLAILFKDIKKYNAHGRPDGKDQENQLDFDKEDYKSCNFVSNMTIHATPFDLIVSPHTQPDGRCNLCNDPSVHVYKFLDIKEYTNCTASFQAVFNANHSCCQFAS